MRQSKFVRAEIAARKAARSSHNEETAKRLHVLCASMRQWSGAPIGN